MGEKAVNVQKTMHDLVAVGKLLQIADLGSDSLNSNAVVKGNVNFISNVFLKFHQILEE